MTEAQQPGNVGWTVVAVVCALVGVGLLASSAGIVDRPAGWLEGIASTSARETGATGSPDAGVAPSPDGTSIAPSPTSGLPIPIDGEMLNSCSNQVYQWRVEYPGSWFVADNGDQELACSLFDPDPIDVEFATSIDVAVRIESVPIGLDSLVDYALDDPSMVLIGRSDGSGAYGRTVSLRFFHDGTGFYDSGVEQVLVYVAWGESTVIVSAAAYPGENLEAQAAVVEQMAASLT